MSKSAVDIVVAAVDAFLAEPAPPPPPAPVTFEQLSRTIASMSPKPLAVKDEPEQLRDAQTQHENTGRTIAQHTFVEAKKSWLKIENDLKISVRNGTVSDAPGWTLQDIYDEFSRKCDSAKVAQRDVSREIQPTALVIAARFSEWCLSLAKALDLRDKADYQKFGLPYQESPLVAKLREIAAIAPRRCGGNTSPKNMLPFIDF